MQKVTLIFSYDEVKNLRKVQAQAGSVVSNPIAARVPAAVGASSSNSAAVKKCIVCIAGFRSKIKRQNCKSY